MNEGGSELPNDLLVKAIRSTNEFGWKQDDFIEVINAAKKIPLAIIGGQVQYVFPDASCELYWLSYDTSERNPKEDWLNYCNRTANECIEKFNRLISTVNIKAEALQSFPFLKDKSISGVNIDDHKVFIIYFFPSPAESL